VGKVATSAEQMALGEATITMPLVVGYAFTRGDGKHGRRAGSSRLAHREARESGLGRVSATRAAIEGATIAQSERLPHPARRRLLRRRGRGAHFSDTTSLPPPIPIAEQ
jgi:hypothetical protein